MKGSWDTIEFANSDDPGSVALQITLHFSTAGNGIRLMGCRNITSGLLWDGNNKMWLAKDYEDMKMFDGQKGNFTIQISEDKNAYIINIFSQCPGSPVSMFSTTFNYNSASVWDNYKFHVRGADLIFINREMPSVMLSRMVKFERISQCQVPLPVPCDQHPEVIAASMGQPYTLSCKVSGAQFLTSKWWKADTELVHTEHTTVNGFVSELVVPAFSVNDIGMYTCEVFNENIGKMTEKQFSLQYHNYETSVISRPPQNKFHADDKFPEFSWLVEGWPLDVALQCSSQNGVDVLTDQALSLEYSPPRIKLTVTVDPKTAPDMINCTVVRGSQVLDTRLITKIEGKNELDKWEISTYILIAAFLVAISFAAYQTWKLAFVSSNKVGNGFELVDDIEK